jgi:2-polyprenyl-3-methyl-5-hydroxy-6-metoxy-1,4-benzoquinol methylase
MNEPGMAGGDDFARWNEEMVGRYDIDRYYERSHPVVRWLERRRLDLLRSVAAPRRGDRVLEVGCGGGHVLARFDGFDRTGVDLSPAMIERSRRRLGEGVTLLRGSAEDLPFDDGSFDVVLCTEVLEHTRDPRLVIRELIRVAAPGARVVVSIPNERNIDRAKQFIRSVPVVRSLLRTLAAEGNEWHLHRFDDALLREMASGTADVRATRGVPFGILPVRIVALLQRRESHERV